MSHFNILGKTDKTNGMPRIAGALKERYYLEPRGKTYNLTVDVGHTVYVGELKTWVHNTGPCGDDGRLIDAAAGPKATGGAAEAPGNISQSSDAATGLLSTQLAKDAKAYLTDIQNLTGRQFPPQQLEFLKADLGENTYSRLSKENVRLNRVEFNEKLPSLRAEWEKIQASYG